LLLTIGKIDLSEEMSELQKEIISFTLEQKIHVAGLEQWHMKENMLFNLLLELSKVYKLPQNLHNRMILEKNKCSEKYLEIIKKE